MLKQKGYLRLGLLRLTESSQILIVVAPLAPLALPVGVYRETLLNKP